MVNDNKAPQIRFSGFTELWEEKKIASICSISTGKSNTQDRVEEGKYPFYVRSSIIERSNRYLYDEEAVLTVGDGVGTGKVFHYVNEKYDLHQRVYRMFDFDSGVDGKYFYYFFSKHFYDRVMSMTAKTSVDSVRLDMISDMDFVFPSKQEQMMIAFFLDNLDEVIIVKKQLYNQMANVKKAMLEKMFPKKGTDVPEVRFDGFTEPWETCFFSDLAAVRRGLTYSPSNVRTSGVRVLRSSNIDEDIFTFRGDDVFVEPSAATIEPIKPNDILITSANGSTRLIGKRAIIPDSIDLSVHGGFMLAATVEEPYFVNALMGSAWYREFLELNVTGGKGAISNLRKTDLDAQLVLVPKTRAEQAIIGDFFRNFDTLFEAKREELEKLQSIKKACFSKMFV